MDIAGLNERESNLSHLLEQHPGLQPVDVISITDALVAIEKHYNQDKCNKLYVTENPNVLATSNLIRVK